MYYLDENGKPFYAPTQSVIDQYSLSECSESEFNSAIASITSENDAETEYQWAKTELESAQVQLMYFWTGDAERQSATEDKWKSYMIALRDYATVSDGVYSYSGDRPSSPV